MRLNDLWVTDRITNGFIYLQIEEINPIIGAEIAFEGPINDPKNVELNFTKGDNLIQIKIPGKRKAWHYKYPTIQEAKDAGQEALGALLVLHIYDTVQKIYALDKKYLPPHETLIPPVQ